MSTIKIVPPQFSAIQEKGYLEFHRGRAPLRAFHDNADIKEFYLARVKAHRAADELEKGVYWENGRGCAIGCTLHSDSHGDYELRLGIPRALAVIEETIFEALATRDAKDWPVRFLESIPVGADLSGVVFGLMDWMLSDAASGLMGGPWTIDVDYALICLHGICEKAARGDLLFDSDWFEVMSEFFGETKGKSRYAFSCGKNMARAGYVLRLLSDEEHQTISRFEEADGHIADFVIQFVTAHAGEKAATDVRDAIYLEVADKLLELLAAAPVPTLPPVAL